MTQPDDHLTAHHSRHSRINTVDEQEQQMKNFEEPLRLGRRESEPHSAEVSYLFEVLSTNYPSHRTLWDLHHYFGNDREQFDIQFDISLFLNFSISLGTEFNLV